MKNISIRAMDKADIPAAMRLKDAEGWNQTDSDWRFYLSHDPELCLVACVSGNVIGTVTAINYNNQVAWIGMMLVDREFRKQGVGKLLFHALLEKLKDCKSIKLDASPAGNPVYRKFGFVEELELQRMIAQELMAVDEVSYSGNIERIQETDIGEVIDYDQLAFGVQRTELIQFLCGPRAEACWMARCDEKLVGLLCLRRGSLYYQLGPVYAQSDAIAEALVVRSARELVGQAVTLDIHSNKSEFRDWLQGMGFNSQRPFHRMYLERNPYIGNVGVQFAISSPELG